MKTKIFFPLFCLAASLPAAERPQAGFRAVDIDTKIEIGYGVAVADVDGDGQPDILLADKKQFVWYKNPAWEKFVLAENLTKDDNVCIAAADIDGDGKCEIATGAGWNPGDTVNSGAVFDAQATVSYDRKYVTIGAQAQDSRLIALRDFPIASAQLGFVGGVNPAGNAGGGGFSAPADGSPPIRLRRMP